MWFLRLLRHPAIPICLLGHALCVLIWALLGWSAGTSESTTLNVGFVMFSLVLVLADLPVVLAACLAGKPILGEVFLEDPSLLSLSLYVLVVGSIQWALIAVLFAIPDLRNDPKR
jgi:hypothetical protein